MRNRNLRRVLHQRKSKSNLQSHAFSRAYSAILPTSLTYIILSTRGCSPWRPAAVISTVRHGFCNREVGKRSLLPIVHVPVVFKGCPCHLTALKLVQPCQILFLKKMKSGKTTTEGGGKKIPSLCNRDPVFHLLIKIWYPLLQSN